MSTSLLIEPLTGHFGAEIGNIDLGKPLGPDVVKAVRDALNHHQVLVFRDQAITPQQQADFANNFGPVELTRTKTGIEPPAPGITVIESENAKHLTDEWHTDHTYIDVPPMAAMLRAVRLPAHGGDTCWANMLAAYDALSNPLRNLLDSLTAAHNRQRSKMQAIQQGKAFPSSAVDEDIIHPVVRVHPETGRKGIFVSSLYTTRIVEMKEAESNALLQFLYRHIQSPGFQLRVRWRPNTCVMWDERSTQHYAVPDYDEHRTMHRLIIAGTKPYGPRQRAAAE